MPENKSFEDFLDNIMNLFIARHNLMEFIESMELDERVGESEILKIIDKNIDRLISEQRTLTRKRTNG